MCALSSPTSPSPFPFYKSTSDIGSDLYFSGRFIYSSDPVSREPLTPTRSFGRGKAVLAEGTHGNGPEARNCGWGCSVSWETQTGKLRLGKGSWSLELVLVVPLAPGLQEDAGAAPVLLPGSAWRAGWELLFLVLPVGRGW